MTTTTEGHFEENEEELLHELALAIDEEAYIVCARHYKTYAQEPPVTSRIIQAIETRLRHHPIIVGGLRVEVVSVDMPDRRSDMERLTGADLYVSLVRRDREFPVSKGMLIQAKWDKSGGKNRMRQQALNMGLLSDDAYVWFYGATGVTCVPALDVLKPYARLDHLSPRMTLGELLSDALRCNRGDPKIGIDLMIPMP